MSKRFAAFSLCIIILIACVLAFRESIQGALRNGNRGQQTKVIWEYKTVEGRSNSSLFYDSELNKLGAQGWELTGTSTWSAESSSQTVLYFKRAK